MPDRVRGLWLALGAALAVACAGVLGVHTEVPPASGTAHFELSVRSQDHPSVHAVSAPLAGLLADAGVAEAFTPDSVNVTAELGGRRVSLPHRLEPGPGSDRIVFELPGVSDAAGESPVEVRVDFGSRAVTSVPLAAGIEPNMLDNGSMAPGPDAYAALSTGARKSKPFASGEAAWAELPGEGGSAPTGGLWLAPSNKMPMVLVNSHWVRVEPGSRLRGSALARFDGGREKRAIVYIAVFFRDAEGKSLPGHAALKRDREAQPPWQGFSRVIEVPPLARFAFIHMKVRKPGTRVFIDDLRLAPEREAEVVFASGAGGAAAGAFQDDPDVRRFDFGPQGSPVLEPFEPVTDKTVFTDARGFGWSGKPLVRAVDRGFPFEALSRDHVTPKRGTFRVRVANGRYRVWVRFGDFAVERVFPIHRGMKLDVAGKRLFESNPSAEDVFEREWLRHYPDLWHPDMDIYDTFVVPAFEERSVEVDVVDGELEISALNIALNAVIVFPLRGEDAAKQIDRELAALSARLKRRTALGPLPRPSAQLAFATTAAEADRGFVTFAKSREERVQPTTRPEPDQRVDRLDVRAARDETEWAFFSIYPLRDLTDLSIRAGSLTGPGGRAFPAGSVDVRFVRYQPVLLAEGGYEVQPTVLDRRGSLDLAAGVPIRFAVQLRVDADQVPGRYAGPIDVHVGGKRVARLPLSLEVLPLTLPPPEIDFGVYYSGGTAWYTQFWKANISGPRFDGDPAMNRITFQAQRAHFAFMRDIGYTGAAFKDDLRVSFQFDGTTPPIDENNRFVLWMDAYTEAGLGRMPYYGWNSLSTRKGFMRRFLGLDADRFDPVWREAYRNLILRLEAIRAERGWPEILWYLSDELSNYKQEGIDLGIEIGRSAEGLPAGVRRIASMNGPKELAFLPYLDIAMPNHGLPLTRRHLAEIRRRGAELWLYNVGNSRFSFGVYPWALSARGRYQWDYGVLEAKERWTLGKAKRWGLQKRGPDWEILPFEDALQHREGIDDYRYLQALEAAIRDARVRPELAAKAAKASAFLDDLRAKVPVDIRNVWDKYADSRAAGGTGVHGIATWSSMDEIRRECVEHLVALTPGD